MKAQAALRYLEDRPNQWIQVTTEETLQAVRELRKEGHPVQIRFSDGKREVRYEVVERDLTALAAEVFAIEVPEKACSHPSESHVRRESSIACAACGEVIQDLPGAGALTPGMMGRNNPMVRKELPDGRFTYEVAPTTCAQCGETYMVRDEHVVRSARHRQWASGQIDTGVAPPVQQPVHKFPLDTPLNVIEFGIVVTCPRCHGRFLGEREKTVRDKKKGTVSIVKLPAEDFSRDPDKKDERCHRCNGWGIVPNQGEVASDSEVINVDANIAAERRRLERARYAPSTGQTGMDSGGTAPDAGPASKPRKPRQRRVGGTGRTRSLRPVPDPLAGPATPEHPGEGQAEGEAPGAG